MKKVMQFSTSLLLALLFLTPFAVGVQAETLDGYRITVIKFKMDEALKDAVRFPVNGVKTEELTDAQGKSLIPLSDVTYVIERVTPIQGTNGFEVVEGEQALHTEIITGDQGEATLGNLPQGTYRVTEQRNAQLKEVMTPVVLELPLPQPSGESLTEVFLYPKSSVVESPGTKVPGEKQPPKSVEKIPQTSGNIGSFYPIAWSMAFVFFMGMIGMTTIYVKRNEL